ncbi:cytochrome P450 [Artomyces pyxidatus]|uniref:Cytochrome P450 n=1 Tax=Artomyces pyxidatus TaxID=48021 RepID=A0ACB8TGQ5_9AGAM|nr:cytochrome P450 [Artomyces pyxidatus]
MIVGSLPQLDGYSWLHVLWFSSLGILFVAISTVSLSMVHHRIRQIHLRKIPGPPNASLVTGNLKQIFNASATPFQDYLKKTYGPVIRISAFFGESQLIISDPAACTSILLRDQDIWEAPKWFTEVNRHVLGPGLTATTGQRHRKQRKQLIPAFSNNCLRSISPLFSRITQQLRDVLGLKVVEGPQEVDVLDLLSRLSLECIAQGGLGYTFNSLDLDSQDNEFRRALKELFPLLIRVPVPRQLFPVVSMWPPWLLRLGAKCIPSAALHELVTTTAVIYAYSRRVFDEKKRLLERGDRDFTNQVGEGRDVISILMKMNSDAAEQDRLSDEEIIAQMATFFLAGTESTSTALARILFLLAKNPEAQERLRHELSSAHAGEGELEYDVLLELPYLEAVCRETLRLHPPVTFSFRICRADTSIPLSRPVQTAQGAMHFIPVPSGTTVLLNLPGCNRDISIWGSDALEWKPDRWLVPLPESVTEARIPGVYSHQLTFLGGRRGCIGFRFSELEIKVALSQLVRCFRFSPSKSEVIWRFGGTTWPSVQGTTTFGPTMPLLVERIY